MRRTFAWTLLLAAAAGADELAPKLRGALVKLHVASQPYKLDSPWDKEQPASSVGTGVLVEPATILTPAANVANHLLLEVSVANSARRYPAKLRHVDYAIGLALVEIADADLAAQLAPLEIGEPVRLDDEFDLYQLGERNVLERSTGRVVRADTDGTRLTLELKTTCADAGNGQLAVKGGKIAGLLVATNASKQEGTLLSLETLRHYLRDFADGVYHGCPAGGIWIHPLLRDDLREYYGVPPNLHGVAVSRVVPGRTGDGVLREGDVLLEIDGFALDDEGMFVDPTHGRLHAGFLLRGRRYAGDTVAAKVLRGGASLDVQLVLRAWPDAERRVPERVVDRRPKFLVVGGLVVLELTGDLVGERLRSVGDLVLRRYRERAEWDPPEARRRIVVADRVLADPANKGYENLQKAVVESVNGRKILAIEDVAKALETPERGFHVFRFEGLTTDFVIPADQLAAIDARVAQTYKVSLLRHLDGDSG
jgi:hypothetical protein